MSIFATLRRPKGKKASISSISEPEAGLRASTVFTSTPNLNLGQSQNSTQFSKNEIQETVFEDEEEQKFEKCVAERPQNFGRGGKMRSFMSLINVMGSLKRSKSVRKLGWGSSMNVASTSPATTPTSTSSQKQRRASKSEDCLDSEVLEKFQKSSQNSSKKFLRANTEPGVISSSSSENSSLRSLGLNSDRSSAAEMEELELGQDQGQPEVKDPAEIERKRIILQGTKKFNVDPKAGLQFLVEKEIIQHTPEDVARFLKDGYGLSKASIGNYLGERCDFNESVLKVFVTLHNFSNLILVQALREFLWGFRLPGESQKISRMLDAFAEKYTENNPDLFSSDTCSVLCYSIIMLNTELHNPNVKNKVSLEQFIHRNRGIEGGERFTVQFMASLYNSILTEPFRFPEEDGNDLMLTFFNPDYEGWLYKLGGRPKSWRRLWFVLSNACLYYFKFTTDKIPAGIIPLENICARSTASPPSRPSLLVLTLYKPNSIPGLDDPIKTCKTLASGATVAKHYPSVQLSTSDPKERDRWIRAINANHSMSQFYSDLTLKKMRRSKSQVVQVRKSQISRPIEQDGEKNPASFFKDKGVSCVDLLKQNDEGQEEKRLRSRSESRLYERKKSLLEVEGQRAGSRSPVIRRKNWATNSKEFVSEENSTTLGVSIFDKYKKLSMIQELTLRAELDKEKSEDDENASNLGLNLKGNIKVAESKESLENCQFYEYENIYESNV